jgi:probable F420-dependent oxidoreductase
VQLRISAFDHVRPPGLRVRGVSRVCDGEIPLAQTVPSKIPKKQDLSDAFHRIYRNVWQIMPNTAGEDVHRWLISRKPRPFTGTTARPFVAATLICATIRQMADLSPAFAAKSEDSPPIGRYGFTAPLPGPLHAHREQLVALAEAGYVDAWSVEVDGSDAFGPLMLMAAWEPRFRLGTAVVPAFTRSPAVIAQSAATVASAAPGRFLLGIGASSRVVVESWSGIPYAAPYERTRDVLRFVREAMTGARIARSYDSFSIDGFRLSRVPEIPPLILLAALRPKMIRLGVDEGDGVILNWVSPDDVARVRDIVSMRSPDRKEIVARIFVCPTTDRDVLRATACRLVTTYLNVPAYAEAQRWHGRADVLTPMWNAWSAGDRRRALEVVPDAVIDELFVHGSPSACRAKIEEYFSSGLTAVSLSILGVPPESVFGVLGAIAPAGSAASAWPDH